MKKIFFPLIFFLFLSGLRSNQSFAWDFGNFKQEFATPINTDAKYPLIIGTGLTLTLLIFEDSLIDVPQREFVDDKPLGDLSIYGDYAGQCVPNFLYIFSQSIAGYTGEKSGYKRAIGMFKATAYAASVTTFLKYTVREPRPNDGKARVSFPSGHATTAFAFGGYVIAEHGWKWGVPALIISTFSGLSRIQDNKHFAHDVLAGATIGLSYGLGISFLEQSKKTEPTDSTSHNLQVVPLYDEDLKGLVLTAEF